MLPVETPDDGCMSRAGWNETIRQKGNCKREAKRKLLKRHGSQREIGRQSGTNRSTKLLSPLKSLAMEGEARSNSPFHF